ncbi:type II toxin-antitoxin system Phd/YefM family antitoxin [Cellulosimicrobium cellulans]|uniref:type II toxin-antitoxin system Phd/YefM family antitoxin n=1 Tax=Cellulosimicrobium cellulans TaxID=1710 RepID=UPI0019658FD9|nr:type II toxin-antitoxin system Phd/YefM family antitoxin [Cellulosimicrobium cellulans]MBN0039617.1 type II toxin-antitoxin system Phd/YefM family antitoxin [Cellulosimicrobium cellulans]
MSWQVQDAKQRLSEVLREAENGPQVITRHGKEIAVVVGIDLYHELAGVRVELADYLLKAPTTDDLEIVRDRTPLRELDLGIDA